LSLLDLCRELEVSERTLHYAFQEVRGLSPMAYFRACRPNAVRQELKTVADTASEQIAQRWGFWHPGEFAAAYRRLFGELPSRTLTGEPRGRLREAHRSLGRAPGRGRGRGEVPSGRHSPRKVRPRRRWVPAAS
jgi:AraC-like DNA-binding protein